MPSIKCGNCGHTHGSALEVRRCYTESGPEMDADFNQHDLHFGGREPVVEQLKLPKTEVPPVDETGKFYLSVPYDDKDEAKALGARWDAKIKLWYVDEATLGQHVDELRQWMPSEVTTRYLSEPKPEISEEESAWTKLIPDGHYALQSQLDGSWKFYKIYAGKSDTRWEGRTFVRVQAGSEYHLIHSSGIRRSILQRVAKDPKQASVDYGLKLGRCGVCNRELTDENSRAAGIGPVCAGKAGW